MKKFLVILLVLAPLTVCAYTYEGDIDPKTFFTYEPLFTQQISPVTALMIVGKEGATPRYAVLCLMRVPGGVVILAYAYYDADFNLKHFMTDGEHYREHPFDPNIPEELELGNRIKAFLDAFHGLEVADDDTEKNLS